MPSDESMGYEEVVLTDEELADLRQFHDYILKIRFPSPPDPNYDARSLRHRERLAEILQARGIAPDEMAFEQLNSDGRISLWIRPARRRSRLLLPR